MLETGERSSTPTTAGASSRWIVALVVVAAAACSAQPYRTSAYCSAASGAIRRVGLLPPMVSLYEEQVEWLLPSLVAHEGWSREAAESLRRAFAVELPAAQMSLVEIRDEEGVIDDMLDLYAAVDFSIRRHVYDEFDEGFDGRRFEYSLGSAAEWMQRQGIDAVWIVAGTNLVPTAAAQARDAVDTLLAVASAAGGGSGSTAVLEKLDLRVALVGRRGTVLFFCVLPGDEPTHVDLRDPASARRAVRRLLAEYAEAAR